MRAPDSGSAWVRVGLVILASLLTYAPTWNAPFAEDDYLYLDALAHADAHRLVGYLLSEGVMDHHYRPLSDPLFFLLARTPLAYHAGLQALHAGAACFVLLLGVRLGIGGRASLLGALLYATRDFFFPSMVWASGISDLGSAFFALAALVLHLAWLRERRSIPRVGSVLAFLGALLCKETASATIALFPLVQFRDGETPRPRSVVAAIWPHVALGLPIVAAQFTMARFEGAYGPHYTLSLGSHTFALWPVYGMWTVLGVREILVLPAVRVAIDLLAVTGILGVGYALARSQARRTRPRVAALLAIGWFTLAILPALLAPNRILTNHVAIAAAGPCLSIGIALDSFFRSPTKAIQAAGVAASILLVGAGPALVRLKAVGRLHSGGWVDPAQARRTAAMLDTLAREALPLPPSNALIVIFGERGLQLVVQGNPDGAGFGPRPTIDSAVRWRYGRSDIKAIAISPVADVSDEDLEHVRQLFERFPDRICVVEFKDGVRDLTPNARRAIDSRVSARELRAALTAS